MIEFHAPDEGVIERCDITDIHIHFDTMVSLALEAKRWTVIYSDATFEEERAWHICEIAARCIGALEQGRGVVIGDELVSEGADDEYIISRIEGEFGKRTFVIPSESERGIVIILGKMIQ